MQRRRRFLKSVLATTGATIGGGVWWVSTSRRGAARWTRQIIADARRSIVPAPIKPTPQQWSNNEITICWLGHATVLINFYGMHILTDPVLGNHIGVSVGLGTFGPKRYIAPALRFGDLPPIDVVLLSHAHMEPWIWNHCTPEQAVEIANQAGAHYVVPVHHQTFRLSNEPLSEPMERLEAALQREPERLALRKAGESFICPV